MTTPGRWTSATWLTAAAILAPAAACGADAAWEYRPYRVQIDWHVAEHPQTAEPLAAEVRDAVESRLREKYGAAWQPADGPVDKRFDVRLDYRSGAYVVAVAEWDALSDGFGPPVGGRTADRATVAATVVATIGEAFRPTVLIDEARDATARVRQRAAALYPPTTLDGLTRRGAAFAPLVRRYDRDGVPLETKPIPWTFLEVDEPRGREAVCLVRSGLHNPLSLRRRGRIEKPALFVGRPTGATVVRVTSRDDRPLAGCRVFVQDGDAPAEPLGATDAAGRIVVPAAEGRVRVLYVTSRFSPLAKLPLVPGLVERIDAPTSGSPELLAAEDRLAAWQTKALDLLIERRVLTALAGGRLEQNDREAAAAALARLDRTTKPNELTAELESLRRRFVVGPEATQRTIAALFHEAAASAAMLDDAAEIADLRRRASGGR